VSEFACVCVRERVCTCACVTFLIALESRFAHNSDGQKISRFSLRRPVLEYSIF
jgi:hypothetical protein